MPTPEPIRFRTKTKPQQHQGPPVMDLGAHMDRLKATKAVRKIDNVHRVEDPNMVYADPRFAQAVYQDIVRMSQQIQAQHSAMFPQPTQEQVQEMIVAINAATAIRFMLLGAIVHNDIWDAMDMSTLGAAQHTEQWKDVIDLVALYANINNERFQQLAAQAAIDGITPVVPDEEPGGDHDHATDAEEDQHAERNMVQ